jgi:uncharacterized protein YjdB
MDAAVPTEDQVLSGHIDPPAVKSLKFSSKKMTIRKGTQIRLSVKVNPETAAANAKIVWKSTKPRVAKVTKNGVVKAKRVGKTVVTAAAETGKKAKIKVTVDS